MRNHPGAFRGFFSTLAAAIFLAMTLSSCAVTVALPGGGSTTTPIKPPTNIGPGTGTRASGGGAPESKPAPSEPTPEEPKPEEPKDEKPTETPKEENKDANKDDENKKTEPPKEPDTPSESTSETPKVENGTLYLPTDRAYQIATSEFQGRTDITDVVIPPNITKIGNGAFRNCTNLERVTIQAPLEEIPYLAFSGCSKLTSIDLPSSLKTIGNVAFSECKALIHIDFPQSLTAIGTHAFYMTGLSEISIPKSVILIGEYAFSQCHSLTKISLPVGLTRIHKETFSFIGPYETASISLVLPDGLKTIDEKAFAGANLTTLYIPESVTSIASDAFNDVYLDSVEYGGSEEMWNDLIAENDSLIAVEPVFKQPEGAPSLLSDLLSIF